MDWSQQKYAEAESRYMNVPTDALRIDALYAMVEALEAQVRSLRGALGAEIKGRLDAEARARTAVPEEAA